MKDEKMNKNHLNNNQGSGQVPRTQNPQPRTHKRPWLDKNGFTLLEALLGSFLIVGAVGANLVALSKLCQATAIIDYRQLALQDASRVIEQLRNNPMMTATDATTWAQANARQMLANHPGINAESINVRTTPVTGLSLETVVVTVCWRTAPGLGVGEDTGTYNGQWDAGEDTLVTNSVLDSPAQLITQRSTASGVQL